MKRIAFVTYNVDPVFSEDDELIVEPLKARGFLSDAIPWSRRDVDWGRYDAVIIRSTWDYQNEIDTYRSWLKYLEDQKVNLWNPAPVVLWNSDKRYLFDLERRGVAIIPSMLVERGSQNELKDILKGSNWEVAIIKPTIGAGASGVFKVCRAEAETKQQIFDDLVRKSDVLIQPFMEEVQVEGEYSFIFFNGKCNHVMLKRQRQNNFNVNAGYLTPVKATKHFISQANHIYRRLPSPVLYARLDVLNVQGKLVLVEAELIEPILFFRWCSRAPDKFAKAVQQTVT